MKYIIGVLNIYLIHSMYKENFSIFNNKVNFFLQCENYHIKSYDKEISLEQNCQELRGIIRNLEKYIKENEKYLKEEKIKYLEITLEKIKLEEKEGYISFDLKEFKEKNIIPNLDWEPFNKINENLQKIFKKIKIIKKNYKN